MNILNTDKNERERFGLTRNKFWDKTTVKKVFLGGYSQGGNMVTRLNTFMHKQRKWRVIDLKIMFTSKDIEESLIEHNINGLGLKTLII